MCLSIGLSLTYMSVPIGLCLTYMSTPNRPVPACALTLIQRIHQMARWAVMEAKASVPIQA